MWIATEVGFYSAVAHRDSPDLLLVRARVRKDLNELRRLYLPKLRIIATPTADYPYRAVVTRREWAHALDGLTRDLDYPNFKDAIERREGRSRHDIYLRVWSALRELEPSRLRLGRMGRQLQLPPVTFGQDWHEPFTVEDAGPLRRG